MKKGTLFLVLILVLSILAISSVVLIRTNFFSPSANLTRTPTNYRVLRLHDTTTQRLVPVPFGFFPDDDSISPGYFADGFLLGIERKTFHLHFDNSPLYITDLSQVHDLDMYIVHIGVPKKDGQLFTFDGLLLKKGGATQVSADGQQKFMQVTENLVDVLQNPSYGLLPISIFGKHRRSLSEVRLDLMDGTISPQDLNSWLSNSPVFDATYKNQLQALLESGILQSNTFKQLKFAYDQNSSSMPNQPYVFIRGIFANYNE